MEAAAEAHRGEEETGKERVPASEMDCGSSLGSEVRPMRKMALQKSVVRLVAMELAENY